MPDPMTKVSFRYNGTAFFGKGTSRAPSYHTGWSEQWYFPGTVQDANLELNIKLYKDLRKPILAKNCTLISVSQTQVEGGRGTYTSKQYANGLAKEVNDFEVVVNFPIRATNYAAERIFQLHGVPDEMVEDGEWQPTEAYMKLVQAFLKNINDLDWHFKGIDKSGTTSQIDRISEAAGILTMTTKQPHGIAGTQDVQILRTLRDSDVRLRGGIIKATAVDATHATLNAAWPHGTSKGGRCRIVKDPPKIYYNAVVNTSDVAVYNGDISGKDAGGPFGSPRGRRPAKRA